MIDSEDIEHMLVEIVTGKPPSIRTPEADTMRAQLQKECDDIAKKGGTVMIHHEIPGREAPRKP
jgi:hypothetical protein